MAALSKQANRVNDWLCVIDDRCRWDGSARPLSLAAGEIAHSEIAECPHYGVTPLYDLTEIASQFDLARVAYKHEDARFGLGSFKALGGAYAVAQLLKSRLKGEIGRSVTSHELVRGDFAAYTNDLKVICASDGNHGRSVAAGAQVFGCQCDIFLHAGVSEGRAEAIRRYGATVVRVSGDYDQSVRAAAAAARSEGGILVADTTTDPADPVPAMVVQGYSVVMREALTQFGEDPPTHIFIQAGVGGLAAAVIAHVEEALGSLAPKCVIVEPRRADCLYQSAIADRESPASGDLETIMAGLACGEPSSQSWPIIAAGADAYMLLEDDEAIAAMNLLADRGEPIVAGESAVAGLAGLIKAATDPVARQRLGLGRHSRIWLIGTEGATDPILYERMTGRSPEQVLAQGAAA